MTKSTLEIHERAVGLMKRVERRLRRSANNRARKSFHDAYTEAATLIHRAIPKR
jgi:hypothetical protein